MAQLTIKYRGPNRPEYQSGHATGADLCAANKKTFSIKPGCFGAVPTGLFVEIPKGYEGQVRPRSGLALKHGIGVLNAPGTIDADYRGEIKVILFNFSKAAFPIKPGMRIAQLVIAECVRPRYLRAAKLKKTKRGVGGFGHTGL